MGKTLYISMFLILILVGLLVGYLYYYYERPIQEESEREPPKHSLNIKFIHEENNVKSPYVIKIGQSTNFVKGDYIGRDYVRETIPVNISFSIYNDQNGDCFYTSRKDFERIGTPNNFRAEIELEKCGEIEVRHSGSLLLHEPVELELSSKGKSKNLAICFKWSKNILSVKLNATLMDSVPTRINAVKCYDLGISLENNKTSIPLEYQRFRNLDTSDSITAIILDGDITHYSDNIIYSDKSNEDIWIEDFEYLID